MSGDGFDVHRSKFWKKENSILKRFPELNTHKLSLLKENQKTSWNG
ncbi:hypothetical protein LTAR_01970 [Leptolinea tardivitalis]|nr:hypothetical protein LTAR_01970 [Leptolinea tardivitalis]